MPAAQCLSFRYDGHMGEPPAPPQPFHPGSKIPTKSTSAPRSLAPRTHSPTTPATSHMSSAKLFSSPSQIRTLRTPSEIIPRLYIADLAFAESPALLTTYHITHILSILPDNVYQPPSTLLPFQPQRLQIAIEDFPFAELAAHLPRTTAWIREGLCCNSDARVLVHCVEGVSRSTSVVAAFLMAQFGWPPTRAVQYVKTRRRVADPNSGFVRQLHEYGCNSLGMDLKMPESSI